MAFIFCTFQSLPEIIKRVSSTDHIKAIERQGAMIADRIANANRANKKKSDEENTVLLRERDEAKAQVSKYYSVQNVYAGG